MLSTFLEKAEGLLNRRFIVAYWFPTFLSIVIALSLRAGVYGWSESWGLWQGLASGEDTGAQLWLLLAFFLLVTLVAYLLEAFTRPVVQTYEGYLWPEGLRRWRTDHHQKAFRRWRDMARTAGRRYGPKAQEQIFYGYPPDEEKLLPTRLGNVLRAAESYSMRAYGMDLPFWWPRLWSLLPEAEQKGVEEALTSLVALLNLAALLMLVTLDGSIYFYRVHLAWWAILILVGGIALAWLIYSGAVVQARSYGERLRAAVDLHRFDLLKALHVSLPAGPLAERDCWTELARWLYTHDLGTAYKLEYEHGEKEE